MCSYPPFFEGKRDDYSIPVGPVFGEVILAKNIKPAAEWLLGPDPDYLLPKVTGSPWECSFTIMFLVHLHHYMTQTNGNPRTPHRPEDVHLLAEIEKKVPNTIYWIMDQAHENSTVNDRANWESGIYDTAICVRAILHGLAEFHNILQPRQTEICVLVRKSLLWLIDRFADERADPKYPLDPIAASQLLRTLIYAHRQFSHFLEGMTLVPAIHEVAFFLINAAPTIQSVSDLPSDLIPYWGDDASTAEALDALGRYIWDSTHQQNGKRTWNHTESVIPDARHDVVERGTTLLHASTIHMANRQADGRWGSEMDSAAALCGYIRACNAIGIPHENYIVLRGLRWLCGFMVFEDGSFLHTSYVTVYYSLTLWETFLHWPLSRKPIVEVYDDALAEAPFRPTTERAMRFELELAKQTQQQEIAALQNQIEFTKTQDDGLRRTIRKSYMAALSLVASLSIAVTIAVLNHLFSLGLSLKIPVQGDFWTFAAFTVPLCISLAAATYRYVK